MVVPQMVRVPLGAWTGHSPRQPLTEAQRPPQLALYHDERSHVTWLESIFNNGH